MQLAHAAGWIIEAGRRLDRYGWTPSVSGNLSMRLDERTVAITRSGGRKGELAREDVIAVDLEGRPVCEGEVPSAETLLHCQLYAKFAETGAVLHGHSVPATVLSRLAGDGIDLAGYEMIKAFDGRATHDVTVRLPVLDNDQDMRRLRGVLEKRLDRASIGYVLRGHGTYAWGCDMGDAMSKLESLEFMIACELEARRAS